MSSTTAHHALRTMRAQTSARARGARKRAKARAVEAQTPTSEFPALLSWKRCKAEGWHQQEGGRAEQTSEKDHDKRRREQRKADKQRRHRARQADTATQTQQAKGAHPDAKQEAREAKAPTRAATTCTMRRCDA